MQTLQYTARPALFLDGTVRAKAGDTVTFYVNGTPDHYNAVILSPVVRVCGGYRYTFQYEGPAFTQADVLSVTVRQCCEIVQENLEAEIARLEALIEELDGGVGTWDELTGTANHIPFSLTPTNVPATDGTMFWDVDEGCPAYRVPDGSSELNKEIWDYYTNISGTTMVDGDLVSVSGVAGGRTAVVLTDPNNETLAKAFIGMVTRGAAHNGTVRVTKIGPVKGLNIVGPPEGQRIFASTTNPGKWQATEPTTGWVVSAGVAKVVNPGNGRTNVVDVDVSVYRAASSVGTSVLQASSQAAARSAIGAAATSHTHVSADITDASYTGDVGKVVKTGFNGQAQFHYVVNVGPVMGASTVYATCNSVLEGIAVLGEADGDGGRGVVGNSVSISGYGVLGSNPNGTAVSGITTDGAGVVGSSTSSVSRGVWGLSVDGTGGDFSSTNGRAVSANSTNNYGARFRGAAGLMCMQLNGSTFNITTHRTISASNATGTKGDVCHDANYLYICTATDTWKRVPLAW